MTNSYQNLLSTMTRDELTTIKQRILERNQHWKSCTDGSYEMALHNAGYHDVCEALSNLNKPIREQLNG